VLFVYVPLLRRLQPYPAILGVPALFIAALIARRAGRRRMGCMALCLCAGVLLSCPVVSRLSVRPWAGFPDFMITGMKGTIVSDSRSLPDGRRVNPCRLDGVYTKTGMYASAGGEVTVFMRGKKGLYTGTEVECRGSFLRADDGDCLFYTGSEGCTVSSSPTGIYASRQKILEFVMGCFQKLGRQPAALLTALFLGKRDGLMDERLFRQAGCSHLLALSGMHIGIITGFLGLLLLPVLGRRCSLLILYGIVLIYLFLTGFGASLNRSAVMFFLLTAPSFFCKKPPPLQVLCLSCIVLAMITPASMETLSFQLSFLALGGILTVGKLTLPILSRLPGCIRYPLSASMGAQIATAPLIAAVFGVVYPVGVLSSIILTPCVTGMMGLGMIYLFIESAGLDFLAGIPEAGLRGLSKLLYEITSLCARVPGIHTPEGAWIWCLLTSTVIIILFLGYGIWRRRRFVIQHADTL